MLIWTTLLVLAILLNLSFGSANIEFLKLLDSQIFWQLRLPRTLTAALAGALLALCGQITQILFRNPLATPYTLGVASSASLGALLAMSLGLSWSLVSLSALIFSLTGIGLLSLAFSLKRISSTTMLLLGVSLNLFCASSISVLQVTSGKLDLSMFLGWIMGSVSVVGYDALVFLCLPALVMIALSFYFYRPLALISIEGEFAVARGFDPKRVRYLLLFFTTVAVACLVTKLGPIGFIGLVVPHLSRKIFLSDLKKQMLGNLVLGALVLVFADLINRVGFSGLGLPVGVITTALGAPALAIILWRQSSN
tara:strand:+ start:91075 stop:92001 length:927 start_codon:yes stop_codon:yes gene_type:complete